MEQLAGILKEISQFIALGSEHLARQLRRNLDARNRRILRHIANLVHLDIGVACQGRFQLFRQRGGLGVSAGKRADKAGELPLMQSRREVDAGDSGGSQQLCETAFAGGRSQRHAIEKNLSPGSAQQHPASAAVFQCLAQFLPCGFKLLRRFHVAKLVEPREFQQNVQAADKRPRSALYVRTHALRPGITPFRRILVSPLHGMPQVFFLLKKLVKFANRAR